MDTTGTFGRPTTEQRSGVPADPNIAEPETARARRRRPWPLLIVVVFLTSLFAMAPRAFALPPRCPASNPDCGTGGGGGRDGTIANPYINVYSRTNNSITTGWGLPTTGVSSFDVQRSGGGAGWTNVYHHSVSGAESFLTDAGLVADTNYCYRVVTNGTGGTKTSSSACGYSQSGKILRPALRVQVRFVTGNVSGAGTSDGVRVSAYGPINGRTGGSTWLDRNGPDFVQGLSRTFDLVDTTGITDLDDLESLRVSKPGGDNWCVSNVAIIVNETYVFAKNLGAPGSCQWLTGDSYGATDVIVNHDELHAYPLWQSYQLPVQNYLSPDNKTATLTLSHWELEERIEAMVGNAIHGTDAYWGHIDGRPVEVTPVSTNRSHVDVDLAGDATGSDPAVDVDFDLVASTVKDTAGNWTMAVGVENATVNIDTSWYQDVGVTLFQWIESPEDIERKTEGMMSGLSTSFGVGKVYSLTATFDPDANLVVKATLKAPPICRICGNGGGVVIGPVDPGPIHPK